MNNVLAERAHKQIYRDGDKVVKVFDANYPKADVLNEALNQARVEETGLPIPHVLGVDVMEDGKWSITSTYIEGRTLEEIMAEDPANLNRYMKEFVALQLEVHSKRCPKLNKLKDKWNDKISATKSLSATTRYELHTRLSSMPKHNKVLHGDFNPSNVIVAPNGKYYLLDWSHATQGNASADAATTYLLFALKDQKLADLYLETFCEMSDTAQQYVQRWIPITAASRLGKGIPEEKELLEKWLDVVEYE
ncbi:MAG: phosphotransferase [Lachnospiraceae bacterium]|jgi:aminoglycoside phosphotransferase (APT) family kinase protein|nr:phosphotransferase [Lachnospiraceae bacterium]